VSAIEFHRDTDGELATRCLRLLVQVNKTRAAVGRSRSEDDAIRAAAAQARYDACLKAIDQRRGARFYR